MGGRPTPWRLLKNRSRCGDGSPRDNSARFDPALAKALTNLAGMMGEFAMRPIAAVSVAREAAAMWRRLARINPALHEPWLAKSLLNLGLTLSRIDGRATDAVRVIEESVNRYRQLVVVNTSLHGPDLARTLLTLGSTLSLVGGRTSEAVEAARESVERYRQLAKESLPVMKPISAEHCSISRSSWTATDHRLRLWFISRQPSKIARAARSNALRIRGHAQLGTEGGFGTDS